MSRRLCLKNKDKKSESNSQLVTVQHVWMHSVPEKASSGTEYACRAQKGFLVYATRFQKPSVLKTGFWGTEGIFGTRNPLLRYRRNIRCAEQPPGVPNEAEEFGSGSEFGYFAKTAICMCLFLSQTPADNRQTRLPQTAQNASADRCSRPMII